MMQFQHHVRLPAPEFAKGIYDQPVPRNRSGNSNSKRASFAMGYPLGAKRRLMDVLQDTSHVVQKQLPSRVQSDSSRQSVEEGESNLPF
jgi:hypothetical protein